MAVVQCYREMFAPVRIVEDEGGKFIRLPRIARFQRQQVHRAGRIDAQGDSASLTDHRIGDVAHGSVSAGHADVRCLLRNMWSAAGALAHQHARASCFQGGGQMGDLAPAVSSGPGIAEELDDLTQRTKSPCCHARPSTANPPEPLRARVVLPISRSRSLDRIRVRGVTLDG